MDNGETCEKCGKPAVLVIDGIGWCAGCAHAAGSCCAEWEPETKRPAAEDPERGAKSGN
ncbi:MAG: hypothetical protein V4733_09310 [Verrucomicrobiota bacterium]